jgi:TonB family protein
VPESDELAVEWYTKAAEQELAVAQCKLGEYYYYGHGVEMSDSLAVMWFDKAAQQEFVPAQFYLGMCYYSGCGVEKSYETAVEWWYNAALQGDADAMYWIGLCCEKGYGVEQSDSDAAAWYNLAAEQEKMDAEAASETVEDENEEQVYDVVEVAPEFPGGMNGLVNYLSQNINYPRISRDNNSQGRALVQFVVNNDGSIQDVEIIHSTGDIYLDKEAVRVVESMPEWKPGMQKGKTVRVKFCLPINFRLQ